MLRWKIADLDQFLCTQSFGKFLFQKQKKRKHPQTKPSPVVFNKEKQEFLV